MTDLRHLGWIPAGAGVGFGASWLFADLLGLPTDLYYLLYFSAVLGFVAFYAKRTGLDLRTWTSRRWGRALALGLVGAVVLVQGVLSHPGTARTGGLALWWDVLWRGIAYGSVDGLLLFAFPWIVAWRALGAEQGAWMRKTAAAGLACAAVLFVTTAYHLGYADFRSEKILQPNIGAAIGAVPTVLSAHPVASPVSHVALHVAAVLHVPDTDLYLPPHRRE